MKYDCWRMLIWKGWNGFFLSILRKLSTIDVHRDCFPDRKCSQLSTVYSSLQQAGWINLLALERQTGAMMEDTVDSGSRCVCEARHRETVFYLTSCWSGEDMIQRQTEYNLITVRRVMAFAFETGSSWCFSKNKLPNFPRCVMSQPN